MNEYDIEGNYTFPRTQPREWRDQPFDGDRIWWRGWPRFVGWCLFWLCLFGLSLWSIAQQSMK